MPVTGCDSQTRGRPWGAVVWPPSAAAAPPTPSRLSLRFWLLPNARSFVKGGRVQGSRPPALLPSFPVTKKNTPGRAQLPRRPARKSPRGLDPVSPQLSAQRRDPGRTAPPSLAREGPGMSSFIRTREKKVAATFTL